MIFYLTSDPVLGVDPDAIVILEVFRKTLNQTPQHVIETCRRKLQRYAVAVLEQRLTGVDLTRCPVCGVGRLRVTGHIGPLRHRPRALPPVPLGAPRQPPPLPTPTPPHHKALPPETGKAYNPHSV